MFGLNVADFFVLGLLFVSTTIGFYRGFLREILTVFTWIIASMIAYHYGKSAGQIFVFVTTPALQEIFGMFTMFFAVVLIGFTIKYIVCRAFNLTGTSVLDRIVGGVFGWLRASLVIIGVLLASPSEILAQPWYKDSMLMPKYNVIAEAVARATPQSFKDSIKKELGSVSFQHLQKQHTDTNVAAGADTNAADKETVKEAGALEEQLFHN